MDDTPACPVLATAVKAPWKPPLASTGRNRPGEFDAVYREHADRIYTYLRARTARREDAADLTQQVFLQAMAAFPSFEDRGLPIAAWLFRIAQNALTDYHRRRQQTVPWDALPDAFHPLEHSSLEDDALLREAILQIRHLVSQLDASKQEVILLRFGGGLKVREIAHVLGRSESAIKTELSRTLRTLKEKYDEVR